MIKLDGFKDAVFDAVCLKPGCSIMDVINLPGFEGDKSTENAKYRLIEELVGEGKLVTISYYYNNSFLRKLFLFPAEESSLNICFKKNFKVGYIFEGGKEVTSVEI